MHEETFLRTDEYLVTRKGKTVVESREKEKDKKKHEKALGICFVAFAVLSAGCFSVAAWYEWGIEGVFSVWGGAFLIVSILFGVALGRNDG